MTDKHGKGPIKAYRPQASTLNIKDQIYKDGGNNLF